jgi:hypothetical protein
MTQAEFEELEIGFYDPAERSRQKARHRWEDERDVAAGRLREVEERNWCWGAPPNKPLVEWETETLLE